MNKQNFVDLTESTPTVATENFPRSTSNDQVWMEISDRSSLRFGDKEYSLSELDYENRVQKEGYKIRCSGPSIVTKCKAEPGTKRITPDMDNDVMASNSFGRLKTNSEGFSPERNIFQRYEQDQSNKFRPGVDGSGVVFATSSDKNQTHSETHLSMPCQPTSYFTSYNTHSNHNFLPLNHLDMDREFQKYCLPKYDATYKLSDTNSRHLHQTSQEVDLPALAELQTQHTKQTKATHHTPRLYHYHHDQQHNQAPFSFRHCAHNTVSTGVNTGKPFPGIDFPHMPDVFLENNVIMSESEDSRSSSSDVVCTSTGTDFLHTANLVPIVDDSLRMEELISLNTSDSSFDHVTNSPFQSPDSYSSKHLGNCSSPSGSFFQDKKQQYYETDQDTKPSEHDQFFQETSFDIWEKERMLNFFKVEKTEVESDDCNDEIDNAVRSPSDDNIHFGDCPKHSVPNFLYTKIGCNGVCEKNISKCLTDMEMDYR